MEGCVNEDNLGVYQTKHGTPIKFWVSAEGFFCIEADGFQGQGDHDCIALEPRQMQVLVRLYLATKDHLDSNWADGIYVNGASDD